MGTALVVYEPQPAPQRNVGGRPSLFNDEIAKRICDTLAMGVTRQAAALEAGINQDTFYDWLEKRNGFSERVARAESKAEVALTETVYRSGTDGKTDGDWKPAIEWLKRRRRADYGDTINLRTLDVTQLLALLQQQAENGTQSEAEAITDGFEDL